MKRLSRLGCWLSLGLLVLGSPVLGEEGAAPSKADRQAEIDTMARQTIAKLLHESEAAKALFEDAYGYAVFDNLKFALIVSGGGGAGVAVEKGSGHRTYMKMGTAGIGLGAGGQKSQVVILFQNEKTFRKFVDSGWEAEASAEAAAGSAGESVGSSFRDGRAVYQFTDKGLMANAAIAGSKFWKNKKLN